MKNENVRVGMKVVPFQKTAENWPGLDRSYEWKKANRAGQCFLYVTGWDSEEDAWQLSFNNVLGTYSSDFFKAEDFNLFVEDWIDKVSEPSPAELAQMDASAEELRLQFEG